MRYLPLLLVSVIYSQVDEQVLIDNDIQRVSEFKRDVAYGQDCDDTEYRDYKGSPDGKVMVDGCPNVIQSVLYI